MGAKSRLGAELFSWVRFLFSDSILDFIEFRIFEINSIMITIIVFFNFSILRGHIVKFSSQKQFLFTNSPVIRIQSVMSFLLTAIIPRKGRMRTSRICTRWQAAEIGCTPFFFTKITLCGSFWLISMVRTTSFSFFGAHFPFSIVNWQLTKQVDGWCRVEVDQYGLAAS